MSIKTRIGLAFILILLMFVGVTYELHVLVDDMGASLELIGKKDTAMMAASDRIQSSLLNQTRILRRLRHSGNPEEVVSLRREEASIRPMLAEAQALVTTSRGESIMAELRRLFALQTRETDELARLAARGDKARVQVAADKVDVHVDHTLFAAQRLMTLARGASLRHGSEAGAVAARAHNIAVFAAPAAVVLAITLSLLLMLSILRPLARMLRGVEAVRRGDISIRTRLKESDELGQFSAALDDTLDHLRREREKLQLANRDLEEEHERASQELELAHAVQARLLPAPSLSSEHYRISAFLKPAGFLGGDFYQFHQRGKTVRVIIGDVAGKGVPAALTMAACLELFKEAAGHNEPSEVLRHVSSALVESIELTPTPFVTALVIDWDPASLRLVFASAGHPMPFIVGEYVDQLAGAPSLPLGLDKDATFSQHEATLGPGKRLVAYTDGLTDMLAGNHRRLGLDPLVHAALANTHLTGEEYGLALLGDLESASVARRDDETLVVLEALKAGASEKMRLRGPRESSRSSQGPRAVCR